MRIKIPSKIDSNVKKQIETKIKDAMKAGLFTKYEAEEPDGLIRIATHEWIAEPKYIGVICNEQDETICGFTMDTNLNLIMAASPTKDLT